MTGTRRHRTTNIYEAAFGYSRAVRRGPFIFVSGTTASSPSTGEVLHPGSAYSQAIVAFQEIISAVKALDGTKDSITRVRMFAARESDTEEIARALKETLGDVAPAATMLVGNSFVSDKMLVEIEADPVVL